MRKKIFSILFTTLIFSFLFQNCASNVGVGSGFSTIITNNDSSVNQINEDGDIDNSASTDRSTPPPSFPDQMPDSNSGSESVCPVDTGEFAVQDWTRFSNSTATTIITIPPKGGVALKFTVNLNSYPMGFVLHDVGIGAKNYSISHCPGTMGNPTLGQNGSVSINADAYADNCNTLPYVRYPGYDNQVILQSQTTCWLQPGKTFYLNIKNEFSETSSEIQLKVGRLLK